MANEPGRFGAAVDLVPIHSVLPEQIPGSGAIIVMRDGSFRMLVRSGSVNFDMKSPAEKQSLTLAFGALVNSLEVDFPIQIVSHSQVLDIDAYTEQFNARLANDRTPPQIKRLIEAHRQHFTRQVKTNKLLQREIYVVVPFKGTQGPLAQSALDQIPGASLVKALSKGIENKVLSHKPSDLEITTARQTLDIRSQQIVARLRQIGVDAHRLNQDEIRRLLYRLFHPSLSERQRDPGFESEDSMITGFSSYGLPRPEGPPSEN